MSRLVKFFSRLPKMLVIWAILVALVPLWVSDFLLDIFVEQREQASVQAQANAYANETRLLLERTVADIDTLAMDRELIVCSDQYVRTINNMVVEGVHLRHLGVLDKNGQSRCGALGLRKKISFITMPIGVAGFDNEIAVVELEPNKPLLMVRKIISPEKYLAGFMPVNISLELIADDVFNIHEQAQIFISGNNLKIGDFGGPVSGNQSEIVYASAIAGAFPIRFVIRRTLEPLRANYAGLDFGLSFLVGAMSFVTLLALLHYARQREPFLSELEQAIKRGEIMPRYQPVIDLNTGALLGCEVLVRWERNGEMIAPDMFISVAERYGLALPMTLRLMEIVRDDLSALSAEKPSLKVSINLFEGHLRDLAIVDDVRNVFSHSGIGYDQLVFELTERQPVSDMSVAIAAIKQLKSLGCRVALDDAGTGHSNLSSIIELGIDIIKIDKVFVSQIQNDKPVPVLDALIEMSKQMSLAIIAEGIETLEQARYLKHRGVRAAQGYLFARPLTTSAYLELASRLPAGQLDDTTMLGAVMPEAQKGVA